MQLEERVTIGQRHTRRIRNQANGSATPDARQDSLDHVATGAAPVASRRPATHRDTRSRDGCISLGMLRLPHVDRAMTSQREITRRSRSIPLAPHIRGVCHRLSDEEVTLAEDAGLASNVATRSRAARTSSRTSSTLDATAATAASRQSWITNNDRLTSARDGSDGFRAPDDISS